jgi:hypothetical protein
MSWTRSVGRHLMPGNTLRVRGSSPLTRSQINIGIALVDGGARPEMARWLLSVLGAANRAYLPTPAVAVDRRRTALHFVIDDRELAVVAARPGAAKWLRIYADGSHDEGPVGRAPGETMRRLFDWLVDDVETQT